MSAVGTTERSTTRPRPRTEHIELLVLARLETVRYLRHPLFLTGVVLTAFTTAASLGGLENIGSFPVIPAFFLGVFGVIVAGRLTRSTDRSHEAIAASPVATTTRSAAMCLACLLPAAVALTWSLLILAWTAKSPPPENTWWFPTLPDGDVLANLIGMSVVPAYGGPVLAVAVARWLRFRGAPVVLALALVAGTLGMTAVTVAGRFRLLAPWALWGTGTSPDGSVGWLPGSPGWYLGYELALCGLAVVAAIAWSATARRTLLVVVAGLAMVAAACAALAITTGPAHQMDRTPTVLDSPR